MPALVFPAGEIWGSWFNEASTTTQLWSHRRNTCLGVWVPLRLFSKSKKFPFQLRKNISNYYFHPGNNWVDAVLVLGRNRSRFTWRGMPVISHSMSKVNVHVGTFSNHLLYCTEKKSSLAENEYILNPPPLAGFPVLSTHTLNGRPFSPIFPSHTQ